MADARSLDLDRLQTKRYALYSLVQIEVTTYAHALINLNLQQVVAVQGVAGLSCYHRPITLPGKCEFPKVSLRLDETSDRRTGRHWF
ncbi:hypothetical protein EVAR_79079_1 [Eumeta japonica]|uniref:Uncharacterized protein n=1 Tax=Eumeta variegata TaxID=151549 RepID=A0A4C1ZQ00_EUMVA|nr:hypothetical protein EVAR_79079_1 [Eumeta japonica]